MRIATEIKLEASEEERLRKLASSNSYSVRLARRSQIVLLAAEGKTNLEIAEILEVGRHQVSRWRDRYAQEGFLGIEKDLPRSGRKKQINAAEIVHRTTQTLPDNATHWNTRSMAAVSGISERSVRRIWSDHGLKPHLAKTFKVSRDPKFVEKLEDIVGAVSVST